MKSKVNIPQVKLWFNALDALVTLLETIAATSSELILSSEEDFSSEEEMYMHHSFAVRADLEEILFLRG